MKKVFQVYNDPGHGWAKVPKSLLKELDIENDITSFSYQLGDFVYLEEDQDLETFINAYFLKYSIRPIFKEYSYSNRSSKIRTYPRYVA